MEDSLLYRTLLRDRRIVEASSAVLSLYPGSTPVDPANESNNRQNPGPWDPYLAPLPLPSPETPAPPDSRRPSDTPSFWTGFFGSPPPPPVRQESPAPSSESSRSLGSLGWEPRSAGSETPDARPGPYRAFFEDADEDEEDPLFLPD